MSRAPLELCWRHGKGIEDPALRIGVRVHLTRPDGQRRTIPGFWDGGDTWRARLPSELAGTWQWRTEADDSDLDGREGTVACEAPASDLPLHRHGPVRVDPGGTHLEHADGTPFFWLADTAWNGVLRARDDDWSGYLTRRREQGFTAVQFVCTHWRGCVADGQGEVAFTGAGGDLCVNPTFFQRLDARVDAIGRSGLLTVPVLLWTFADDDPGEVLSEDEAVRLARFLAARWGAWPCAWFLGGDGRYRDERADHWHRVGRRVFDGDISGPVTLHPRGTDWLGEFRDEPWFDFIGYQSGHNGADRALQWLVDGPPARDWQTDPVCPVINLEPNYEDHPAGGVDLVYSDLHVRRAAWWSCLVSPTAGVSYGVNATWVWAGEPQVPDGHTRLGTVAPWRHGLERPGVASMGHLRRFFDSGPWWALRPRPDLAGQAAARAPELHVAAAATEGDGAEGWVVIYLPAGAEAELVPGAWSGAQASWFDPATGQWLGEADRALAAGRIQAPAGADRVLDVRFGGSPPTT